MIPEVSRGARVALRDNNVKLRQEKFGTVIFDTMEDKVFVAKGTANRVLPLILSGNSMRDAAKQLTQEYEGDESQILQDIEEFVKELLDKSLVRVIQAEAVAET
jgi:hypothetical protein